MPSVRKALLDSLVAVHAAARALLAASTDEMTERLADLVAAHDEADAELPTVAARVA